MHVGTVAFRTWKRLVVKITYPNILSRTEDGSLDRGGRAVFGLALFPGDPSE